MALITNEATLKSEVASWLNRTDLTTAIGTFIQIAEAQLRKDSRIRRLVNVALNIAQDDLPLFGDFKTLEGLYHDSDLARGAIETVNVSQIGDLKAEYGATGPPAFVAIIANGTLMRFAPAPDQTYAAKISYWSNLPDLSIGPNWLILEHPDIYLYATLLQSAMFLKDDARMGQWAQLLSQSVESLHQTIQDEQFSGAMSRQFTPIGG